MRRRIWQWQAGRQSLAERIVNGRVRPVTGLDGLAAVDEHAVFDGPVHGAGERDLFQIPSLCERDRRRLGRRPVTWQNPPHHTLACLRLVECSHKGRGTIIGGSARCVRHVGLVEGCGALLVVERRRQPQYLIGEIDRVIAEQKSAEAENQFSQRDLVRQQNAGVRPMGFIPGLSQLQEVPGVMCEQGAVFAGRKRELEFVRGTQVSRFASGEAIHAVLAQDRRQRNRHGFVEYSLTVLSW